MDKEETIIKDIDGLIKQLQVGDEFRVSLLEQIFKALPSPISPAFQRSLITPSSELSPILMSLHQLLRSEMEYLSKLECLTRHFILPLQTGAVRVKFILKTTIFGSIDVLVSIHKQFLQKLKNAYDSYPDHQISKIFLETFPSLRIYSDYVKNYSIGKHELSKEKENSQMFNEFIALTQEEEGVNLDTLLSFPLNRIQHYCVFVDSLKESASSNGEICKDLEQMQEGVKKLHKDINDSIEISDNMEQLLNIEKKVIHMPEGFRLVDEYRKFVKEGSLRVVTGKDKKSYFLFLFNDGILQTISLPKGQYRYVSFFTLQYSSVILGEGTRFEWTDGDTKTLTFNTNSKNEAIEWEEAMREQIDKLQETEIFGRTLQDVLKRYPSESGIPFIVEELLDYIEKYCTEISGVFRISGSATSISRSKDLLNRGIHVDISTLDDHVVTGLLKQFLREMEDTIIPMRSYDDFMKCNDKDNVASALREFLSTIPPENYVVLKRLVQMLNLVAIKEPINMMNPQNLAIVFGVNLARSPASDDTSSVNLSLGLTLPLFETMITNFQRVFSSFKCASPRVKKEKFSTVGSRGKRSSISLMGLSRVVRQPVAAESGGRSRIRSETNELPENLKLEFSKSSSTTDITRARKKKGRKKVSMKSIATKKQDILGSMKKQEVRTRPRRTMLLTDDYLKCHCCSEQISETSQTIFIDAVRRCHQSCFMCNSCDIPLEFGSFTISDQHLVCAPCHVQNLLEQKT